MRSGLSDLSWSRIWGYNYWLSVTSDYDCILAMLFGSSIKVELRLPDSQYLPLLELSGGMHCAARPGWQHQATLTLTQCVKGRDVFLTCSKWYCGTPGFSSLGLDPKDSALEGWKLAEDLLSVWHRQDSICQQRDRQLKPLKLYSLVISQLQKTSRENKRVANVIFVHLLSILPSPV